MSKWRLESKHPSGKYLTPNEFDDIVKIFAFTIHLYF